MDGSDRQESGTSASGGFRILFIGDIVGSSGVWCVKKLLPEIIKDEAIDFVIANGEGATGGFGIGRNHSIYLHKLGIDVITGGECIYFKKDMVPHIAQARYILRPANYPAGNPGRGWMIFGKNGRQVGVVNMLGQAGFSRVHLANPYIFLPGLLEKIREETKTIIVDFHATTTAEKSTMFYHIDGKASALIGTHTRVQTADETVMPGGTAVISCAGRTGSSLSVGGLNSDIEIGKFITQIPDRSLPSWEELELQGVIVEVNEEGRAEEIVRIRRKCEEVPDDRKRDSERCD